MGKKRGKKKRIEVIHHWALLLNKANTKEEIFKYTLQAMEKALGFKHATIGIKTEDKLKMIEHKGPKPFPKTLKELSLNEKGLTIECANTGKSIIVNDVSRHPECIPISPAIKSELVVPIQRSKKIIGIINAESTEKNAFDDKDKKIMETLAAYVAVAILNQEANHHIKKTKQQMEKIRKKLRALNQWARRLNEAREMEEIFEYTLDAMEKTLGFHYGTISLKKEDILKVEKYRGYKLPEKVIELPLDGKGITVKVLRSGNSLLANNVNNFPEYIPISPKIKSELAVPIQRGDEIIGVLNAESTQENAFNKRGKRLMEMLASHVAVAIKEVQAYEQLERAKKQIEKAEEKLEILHDWARLLNKAEEKNEILEYTFDAMETALGFKDVAVALKKGNKLKLEKIRGQLAPPTDPELSLDGPGLTVKAINEKKTILAGDVSKHPEYLEGTAATQSELVVPIQSGNTVIGILNAESTQKHAFNQKDKGLMEVLASHVAVAIKKLRERKKREEMEEKFEALHKWARRLNDAVKMEEVFEYTLDAIEKTLGFEYADLKIKKENHLLTKESRGFKISEKIREMPLNGKGITVKVVKTGEPLLADNVHNFPEYIPISPKIKSELAVPIQRGDEIIGVLNAESTQENAFNKRDKRLMETLASHVAVAIKKIKERKKRVSLQKLDRLRERFLIMAAHEINTPITPIKTDLEMLYHGYHGELTDTQQTKIKRVIDNVDRLTRLVDEFREISKLRSGQRKIEKEKCAFAPILKEILEDYKDVLQEEKITLKEDIEDPLSIVCNPERISRAIRNLMENAIDYTEDKIWVSGREQAERIRISIKDNGPGIPEDEQGKIFEPFYRIEKDRYREDRKFGGTGLGLNICKRIMKAHNGKIKLESTIGEGSTFTIILPKNQ